MNLHTLNYQKVEAFFRKASLERTLSNLKDILQSLPEEIRKDSVTKALIARIERCLDGHASEVFEIIKNAEVYGKGILKESSSADRVTRLTIALIGNELISFEDSGIDPI